MDDSPVDEVEAVEASVDEGVDAKTGDQPAGPRGDAGTDSGEWQDVDDDLSEPLDSSLDGNIDDGEADDADDEDARSEEGPSSVGPSSVGPSSGDVPADGATDQASSSQGEDVDVGDDGDDGDDGEDDDRGGPGPGADLTDEQIVERALSLLFASPDPLSVGRLVGLLERPPAARVRAALDAIRHQLESGPLPVQLRALKGGYTLMTVPEMGDVVGRLAKGSPIERISPAALETLAIVAYRQPVTKAEIEAIRGVQAGPILRSLVDRGLAKVTGRADVPGHPLQYGTTKDFLDRFGLMNLEELPRDAELAKD